MKYLLFALLAYVAWRWITAPKANDAPSARASEAEPSGSSQPSQPDQPTQPTQSPEVEKMVGCAHCGIHLPQSEAVRSADALDFCSEDHRRQYAGPTRS